MSSFVRFLIMSLAVYYAVHNLPLFSASLTLEDAAKQMADKVAKGMIVTAEADAESLQYAVCGKDKLSGSVPKETILFEIGSITKVFNGLLLAQAVVEGKITLDTPLKRALGLKEEFSDPQVAEITPLQLVTHTSGLPRLPWNMGPGSNPENPYAHFNQELLCEALKSTKLQGEGPFTMEYSNFGAGLLGAILASVYQTSWEDLVAEKITGPLGMKDTVVTLNRDQQRRFATAYDGGKKMKPWNLNVLVGAGGLRSTARDMVLFGRALNDPDKTPLNQAIKLLLKPHTPNKEMGLGIFIGKVDGMTIYDHSGGTGGYRSMLRIVPETKKVYVVLINDAQVEATQVLQKMRAEQPRTEDSGRKLGEDQLSAYEGVYSSGKSQFTILKYDGALLARLTGQTFLPIYPHEQEDRFFYKAVAAELQFNRKGKTIHSLVLFQNGREIPFERSEQSAPAIIFREEAELKDYAGVYALSPQSKFKVVVYKNTVLAKLDSQPALPVFETEKDIFEYDVVSARLVFERDNDGKVNALQLHQNGRVMRAEKEQQP